MRFVYDNFRNKPFKPLYNALVPKSYRKKWHYNYSEIPTQMHVAEFWQDAITKYQNGELDHFNLIAQKPELIGKKIIWQFWAQGLNKLPENVQICFNSVQKYKCDYEIIRLDMSNISNFISIPKFISEKFNCNNFTVAHYSDFLRISLLKVYGGIWLDASIIVLDKIKKCYVDSDFFIYSRNHSSINKSWGEHSLHHYFNWSEKHKVNYLNSIIIAKPNSDFINAQLDLLHHYWKTKNSYGHYFFYQIMLNELLNLNTNFKLNPTCDDTYPHLLFGELNKKFNQNKFDEIKHFSIFQKISIRKKFSKKDILGNVTTFGKLCSEFNND